jgi:two-component system invasion response regulator UvrY
MGPGIHAAIRILLVDDHPIVRRGLRQVLLDAFRSATVGEASDAAGAMASLRSGVWDLVLLDISLPGPSGLDLLKELQREWPDLPVLVLSMHSAAQFERRVRAAGAAGYLTKDAAPTELIGAIAAIRDSHRNRAVARAAVHTVPMPHDALSDREYQVLRMLGSGWTPSEVGARLGISVKTVSTYRARILEKLHMTTSAELMRYAIENSLTDS